jgi:glycerol-3-phosphate dehydrogenase
MENYCSGDRKVVGVKVRDRVSNKSFEIRSRVVVNAAGPWCDSLNQTASLHRLNTGFARGAHIITRPLLGNYAVALPSTFRADGVATRGNRHIFVIPWRGYSLIGTSYIEANEPSGELVPTNSEIDQLIETVNASLPQAKLNRADVRQSFAGYYPLQNPAIQRGVYQGTGEYQLVDHSVTDNLDGLVTALGAKFTTGRRLGEMTAQLVQKKLGRQGSRNNPTRRVRLVGGDINDLAKFRNDCIQQYSTLWPEQICLQLVSSYGTRIDEIAQLCRHRPDLAELLARGGDTIAAQVVWAAQHESVVHLADILLRRTDLCLLGNPGDTVLERCAQLAGDVLNWSEERRQAELESLRIELGRSIPAA